MEHRLFTAPSVFNFANYPLKQKEYQGSYNCDLKRPNYVTFTPKICNPCVSKGFEPIQKIHMDKSLPSATCFIKNAIIKSKDFVLQPLIDKRLVEPTLKYYNSVCIPMTKSAQSVFIEAMVRMEEIQLENNLNSATITVGCMGQGVIMPSLYTKRVQLKLTTINKKNNKHKHRCPIIPTFIFIIYKSETFTECYKIKNSKDCDLDYTKHKILLNELSLDC